MSLYIPPGPCYHALTSPQWSRYAIHINAEFYLLMRGFESVRRIRPAKVRQLQKLQILSMKARRGPTNWWRG